MTFLAIWLPPLVWMAAIGWFSTGDFSAEATGGWFQPLLRALLPWASEARLAALHALARKGAHVAEYAILAALWLRAFVRGRAWPPARAAWAALAISLAWAVLDEWHQSTLPERTGSAVDVLVDGAGAAGVLVLARLGWRRVADAATTVLLWLAAAGGAGLLVVNLLAGAPSGPLWLTVPLAALVLLVRWRRSGARG